MNKTQYRQKILKTKCSNEHVIGQNKRYSTLEEH